MTGQCTQELAGASLSGPQKIGAVWQANPIRHFFGHLAGTGNWARSCTTATCRLVRGSFHSDAVKVRRGSGRRRVGKRVCRAVAKQASLDRDVA